MDSIFEGLKCICRCCGLFILAQESQFFVRNDPFICNAIMSRLLVISDIDSCSISADGIRLCPTCCRSLLHGNRPKFRILNSLLYIECQSYLSVLADFFLVEEAAIARTHPVMSILKLRLSGAFNPATYSRIKGHAILFPQNPTPLLNLLPSPTLALHDVIRIVWVGQGRPTDSDLRHFILVRKQTLVDTLTWLQTNNSLYRNVVINHDILSGMPHEFIPEGISFRVVIMENDISKRKGYGVDLSKNNDENDLHHVIGFAGINKSGILSGCIYTNVNKSRQNPYLKLISAIHNLSNDSAPNDNSVKDHSVDSPPVITYNLQGDRKPLNDWDNPDFFLLHFLSFSPMVMVTILPPDLPKFLFKHGRSEPSHITLDALPDIRSLCT